jgi:hypothetical protein
MDEIEDFGHITALESKRYSNKIYLVSEIVPTDAIDAAVSRLEAEILQKQAERDRRIKKIRIKKHTHTKVEKKTLN